MRRADRLLQIVHALRRARGPLTAQALADELEVSRRTIYRDVLDLQTALVPIEGAAGVGYVLRPGYDLPPLMFTVEEVETIVLGVRLAAGRGDAALARAADDVLAKLGAVLPPALAGATRHSALLVPGAPPDRSGANLAVLRRAIRDRTKITVAYDDKAGATTRRVLWPLAMLFFAEVTLLGAWCELRGDFRFFRIDRLRDISATGLRFDARNGALLNQLMTRHEAATALPDLRRRHG